MEIPSQRMQASINQGEHLISLTVYPVGYDPDRSYPMIVLLHGMGASMYDLANLVSVIDSEGYIFVCPNAPVPVQVDQGVLGFAWSVPGSDDPRSIERSEEKFDGFLQEVMAENRVVEGKSIMFGFSQGGTMTYRYGLSHPEIFAGLVAPGHLNQGPGGDARAPACGTKPEHIHRARSAGQRGARPQLQRVSGGGGLHSLLQGVRHGPRDKPGRDD